MNAAYQAVHMGLIKKAVTNYRMARNNGNSNAAKGYRLQVRDLIRAFRAVRA